MLDQRIGGDGGAMAEIGDGAGRLAEPFHALGHALGDGDRQAHAGEGAGATTHRDRIQLRTADAGLGQHQVDNLR